jgi:hypothetical protein
MKPSERDTTSTSAKSITASVIRGCAGGAAFAVEFSGGRSLVALRGVGTFGSAFAHGTEEASKPRPFQSKGSGTLKSQTDSCTLTYWNGIIHLGTFVSRKSAKRLATRPHGGFQGSMGSPTTSPDQLRANTIDLAAGSGNGLGGGGDFAISGDGSWQATGTVGAGIYGFGGAATAQFSRVLPASKE